MEKTMDEILYEKLRDIRRKARHGRRPEGPVGKGRRGMPEGGVHGRMRREGHLFRERVLLILHQGDPEGMRQKDIQEEYHANPSSLSEMIAKLEADGYIERKTDPEDGRASRICLSKEGEKRVKEIAETRKKMLGELFANLDEQEKEQLLALLNKVLGEQQ